MFKKERNRIRKAVKENPRMPYYAVARMLGVSKSTVSRAIREETKEPNQSANVSSCQRESQPHNGKDKNEET